MNASPSMFSTGNGPNTLESAELPRLSPITKTPLGHLGRLVGAGEGQVLVQVWLFLLLPVHQRVPLRTSISSPATPTTRLMSFWSSLRQRSRRPPRRPARDR